MAGIKFTRDEVILTLDAFYQTGNKRASIQAPQFIELSELLNRLPIHSEEKKRKDFRTITGIVQQINLFLKSCDSGEKSPDIGREFFEVAFEYEGKTQELHQIANSIKNNEKYFNVPFGHKDEGVGFPEGNLLGHLHRTIEKEYTLKESVGNRCEICGMQPESNYLVKDSILEFHLIVPPSEMKGNKKYGYKDFILVCPNCHAVLHHFRPWLNKNDMAEILQ